MDYIIMTDSNSEIPFRWEDDYNVAVIRMPYTIDGEEFYYDLGRETDYTTFYDRMRRGAKVITTQRNPQDFLDFWRPLLEQGNDILYIGFSSNLSGTFHCAELAREEILAQFPDRRISLVDTLTICMPLGLLVKKAVELKQSGKTMDETAEWIETNKQRVVAYFTVDDLVYLRRGGRVSGAAALIGTMLEVKPVLYTSPEGKLVPIDKVKGRKKALKYLVDKLEQKGRDLENETVVICQADCVDEAHYVKREIEKRLKVKEILINPVGPVIGSHAGPGTVALAFFSDERESIKD